MPYEIGVFCETVILSMLKHKYSIFTEHVAGEYQFRYLLQFLQCVWWVGKNQAVIAAATAYETENVVSYYAPVAVLQSAGAFLQVGKVQRVHFNRCHFFAAS